MRGSRLAPKSGWTKPLLLAFLVADGIGVYFAHNKMSQPVPEAFASDEMLVASVELDQPLPGLLTRSLAPALADMPGRTTSARENVALATAKDVAPTIPSLTLAAGEPVSAKARANSSKLRGADDASVRPAVVRSSKASVSAEGFAAAFAPFEESQLAPEASIAALENQAELGAVSAHLDHPGLSPEPFEATSEQALEVVPSMPTESGGGMTANLDQHAAPSSGSATAVTSELPPA